MRFLRIILIFSSFVGLVIACRTCLETRDKGADERAVAFVMAGLEALNLFYLYAVRPVARSNEKELPDRAGSV
jgi:hypothetical protein